MSATDRPRQIPLALAHEPALGRDDLVVTPANAATGSFHWFGAFRQDEKDNAVLLQHKLTMPVMTVGGDHSTGGFLGDIGRKVATNVKEVKIKDAGHWIVEEQTAQVQAALLDFFK